MKWSGKAKGLLHAYAIMVMMIGIILIVSGCHAQPNAAIQGHIVMSQGWKPKVYLIHPNRFQEIAGDYLGQVIDSALIQTDGSFIFRAGLLPVSRTLLVLAVQKDGSRFANHLMDESPSLSNYMPVIYIPDHTIRISSAIAAFQANFTFMDGPRDNLDLIKARDIRSSAFAKYTNLIPALEADSLLIEKETAYEDYISSLMAFADTTNVLEAAMVATRWIAPTNDFERIPEYLAHQCKRWGKKNMEHPYVADLCAKATPGRLSIQVGDTIPDMFMPLITGDTVHFHSLLGSRLTILDIWASWCAPCRKENRTLLLPIWQTYHAKGLQIISYSIDAEGSAWRYAVRADKINWLQAAHLTGDSTPFMNALRITSIPANYILDQNGVVLAKNLHGDELKMFLQNRL